MLQGGVPSPWLACAPSNTFLSLLYPFIPASIFPRKNQTFFRGTWVKNSVTTPFKQRFTRLAAGESVHRHNPQQQQKHLTQKHAQTKQKRKKSWPHAASLHLTLIVPTEKLPTTPLVSGQSAFPRRPHTLPTAGPEASSPWAGSGPKLDLPPSAAKGCDTIWRKTASVRG